MGNRIFFARGKRSNVYLVDAGKKKAVAKFAKSKQFNKNLKNEAKWLKTLNKLGIGPRLIKSGKGYIICELVNGERILDWAKKHSKSEIRQMLVDVLKQCRVLDKLYVDKKEMTRPVKHIIIDKKPVMIDFERCKTTKKPKNVTQFFQFIMNNHAFKAKRICFNNKELIQQLKAYKSCLTEKQFNRLVKLI